MVRCRAFHGQHDTDVFAWLIDKILIKARKVTSFQKPSGRDYRSVRAWFSSHAPLVGKEDKFIKCQEDIVSIRTGREWSAFDGIVESFLRRLDCSLMRVSFAWSACLRFS